MKKAVIIASFAASLINFRGELIKALIQKGYTVTAIAPERGFGRKIGSELGASYRRVPLRRTGLNPVYDLITFLALFSYLLVNRPQIVLSYTIKPVIYGSLAARIAGVPGFFSIITGSGYFFSEDAKKESLLFKWLFKCAFCLYRLALHSNKAVFFQNPDDLNLFQRAGLLGKNTVIKQINGSGVDVARYYYCQQVIKPFSFLLIARLIREKGIVEYVEAARRIKKDYPEINFRLIGFFEHGHPAAITPLEIRSWVAEGVIDYPGETDDVRPFLAECSVYVLPSYREGTPRTVLEAMSMGRPIITTDAPGCRETVREGENGFLVEVKNSLALEAAMRRFIANPELVYRMGKKSRQMAVEKYDVHKVNRVILDTMDYCLGENGLA